MSDQIILFFLLIVIVVLVFVVLYQRFAFRRGIRIQLIQISRKLEDIAESDSDEKVMVFTDEPVLMELVGEINRLLLDRQKIKAEFKRGEIASKKMLANISHDIKTPLTVILGYLAIMRLADTDDEMLKKVEAKAKQVVDLINQFFTLAKLEAGDANITLSRINASEICRESALGFYEILLQKDFEVELSIPEKAVYVQSDKDALQRILFNLLSNAVRYGDFKIMDDSRIRIYELSASTQKISKELLLNGVEMTSITKHTESLEDYFLKLTGEGEKSC